jgi:hypothetical protein
VNEDKNFEEWIDILSTQLRELHDKCKSIDISNVAPEPTFESILEDSRQVGRTFNYVMERTGAVHVASRLRARFVFPTIFIDSRK